MWLLVFGVGTVLLRGGLALLACGSVHMADVADTLVRAAAETAAALLAFWAVGAALLLGHHGPYLSFDMNLVLAQSGDSAESAASEFFHAAVAVVGGAVVAGAVTGRARFHVGVVVSAVLGGIVFPVVGHWVWFGWLRSLNVIDFGGATAVHLTAAVFAAIAVAMVGSRANRGGVGRPGLPLVGAGVLLVGWFPYLLGSMVAHPTDFNAVDAGGLALTAMNTALAAAGGLLGGLGCGRMRHGRADGFCAYTGLLGGLVAITAGCVAVGNLGAVMIGVVAGLVVPAAALALDRRAGLDDPIGLVAIHGIGAVWGTLAAAMFAAQQSGVRHLQLLAIQSLALAAVLVFAAVAGAGTFAVLRLAGPVQRPVDVH